MNIRRRTTAADCAPYLHGSICAFLSLHSLSLDHCDIRYQPRKATAPTRSLLSSIESDLMHTTTMGTPAACERA